MAICTFFGHRDINEKIEPILKSTLIDLIELKGVNTFYVGNNGSFDIIVRKLLRELKIKYPYIKYQVVLSYLPTQKAEFFKEDYSDTVFPYELEFVPPKYAIYHRNRWMIEKSDYVVTYVIRTIGGAAKFKELSIRKNRTVIEISSLKQI